MEEYGNNKGQVYFERVMLRRNSSKKLTQGGSRGAAKSKIKNHNSKI
jgi:hypothetical protein